nr:immunoglobulin light chain junction region [Macaca mulatta]MOV73053.1 immunoglobulin light chain junction region [Macaca mulatta]
DYYSMIWHNNVWVF